MTTSLKWKIAQYAIQVDLFLIHPAVAVTILKIRFAKGELSKAEYEEMLKTLTDTDEHIYTRPIPVINQKNPVLAAILSFLVLGIGQIYAGRIVRGLAVLFFGALLGVFGFLYASYVFPLIFFLLFWMMNIADAYELAKLYNRELKRTGAQPW